MAREEMRAAVSALGLTMRADFVPFSQSRNKAEKIPSLNWIVTIVRDGRDVLTTEYGRGSGHAPAGRTGMRQTGEVRRMIAYECEHGRRARYMPRADHIIAGTLLPGPDICDVLYSLASDSDVIDCATFEEWADNLGYDKDSRSAEKTYRACLEIALKLRAGLGEAGLTQLRQACQDY